MPKMKSNRSAAKRFRVAESGAVKRSQAFKSHILTKKSAKRKRGLVKAVLVTGPDARRVKRLLPGT